VKLRARFDPNATTTAEREPSSRQPRMDSTIPPAARNLALAHRLAQLIEQGLVADYTAAAALLGVSQPRLTHLMSLALLAPQIQEAILLGELAPGDKQLRALARIADWSAQLEVLAEANSARRIARRPQPSPANPTPSLPATERSTSHD
jgi:hypothetical protein